jgi:hypothetical protein
LRGLKVRIVAVMKRAAAPDHDPDREDSYLRDEDAVARAGGVTAEDRIEMQPWLAAAGGKLTRLEVPELQGSLLGGRRPAHQLDQQGLPRVEAPRGAELPRRVAESPMHRHYLRPVNRVFFHDRFTIVGDVDVPAGGRRRSFTTGRE